MSFEQMLLVIAAVIPAIILGCYIFKKDRVEKEPIGLLALIFGLGVLSCIPTIILESIGEDVILGIMGDSIKVSGEEIYASGNMAYYIYQFLTAFFGVALIEEVCKWFAMRCITVKHREFDNLFDGVIYGAFAALGFATLENILYVLQFGWQTAVMRALLSVPGHVFYGVIMGYYYSFWNIAQRAKNLERKLKEQNKIPMNAKEFSSKKFAWLSIVIPTFYHGAYDFFCFIGTPLMTVLLLVLVVFLYIYCFGKIRKMSKADGSFRDYYINLILKKYPNLTADVPESDSEIVNEIIEKA